MTYPHQYPDHTHDRRLTQVELARHVRDSHKGTDGRMRSSALSSHEHMQWSKEDLENLHAELHGDGNTREFDRAGVKF